MGSEFRSQHMPNHAKCGCGDITLDEAGRRVVANKEHRLNECEWALRVHPEHYATKYIYICIHTNFIWETFSTKLTGQLKAWSPHFDISCFPSTGSLNLWLLASWSKLTQHRIWTATCRHQPWLGEYVQPLGQSLVVYYLGFAKPNPKKHNQKLNLNWLFWRKEGHPKTK